jgi:rifampicin phosphotransferase
VGEDLADASFAGQYETVLGVRGPDEVMDAVSRCLTSADASRVTVYRSTAAIDAPAGMGVLVQTLVLPDAAGVAFSANPVTGDREEVLVSAVLGLGDRLVSGDATPDEWTVRASTATCVNAPEGALEPDEVHRIAQLARAVEAERGTPQDIEWALADGRLHLLQARPITALPHPPALEPPTEGYWEKDVHHYPSPLTPFGASVYLPALGAAMPVMREDFGLLFDGVQQVSLGGEVYARIVPPGGKERPAPPWWVLAIVCRLVPDLRRRNRTARQAMRDDLAGRLVDRWEREWRHRFLGEAAALRAVELTGLDDVGLLAHMERARDLLYRGQVVHFRLAAALAMVLYELARTCEDLLGWDATTSVQILAGNSTASAAPTLALDELADLIWTAPAAAAALQDAGGDLVEVLTAADPVIADRVTTFLDRFGHRPAGNYEPGVATLAERPELLAALLRDRVTAETRSGHDEDEGKFALAHRRLDERPAEERNRFDRAYEAARRAYASREDNVLIVDGEPCGLLRYAAVEIGRRLVDRGLLARSDDAVWLEYDELADALQAGNDLDARSLVARRRAEHAWVSAHPGPASLGVEPSPPPRMRALPAGLRHVMGAMLWNLQVHREPAQTDVPTEALAAGLAGSPGIYAGPVRIIRSETEFARLRPGDVLVCPTTSPVWSVLFGQARALVTDHGGLLSHPAVIAREHRIPAVLATRSATTQLTDGQVVTVDGTRGIVLGAADHIGTT